MNDKKNIILFDGICNFCNQTVVFVLKRDRKGYFSFSSLQSNFGQNFLKAQGMPTHDFDSMIFVQGDKIYTESSAALQITKHLSGLWPVFSVFLLIPRPIRDYVYRLISKNRYKWFGKRDVCMVAPEGSADRFLE